MPGSKLSVPPDARVTVMVYVLVAEPPKAVTTVVMVFSPTANSIGPEAVPDVTAVPFTVTVALLAEVVGVTVILLTPFTTLAV